MQIVNIRVSGATALLGLRSDLARLLSVDADLRSSFLASDEQVRRVLVEALSDPDDMKKLRVFWSQWSGDGQRYVYQSDRSIIDRLADKMLHGPLAIIIYRDETQLFPRRTEFGGNDALFAERALAASSNQFRSTDLTTPTSGGANRFSHEAANPFAPQAANPLAPQGAGPGGQRPGMAGVFTQAGQSAPATSVHAMSIKQRFMETLLRVPNFLTGETKRQFLALLEPTSLEFMAAAFTLWAIGHFFGASEILDAAVLLFGALGVFLMGRSLLDGIEDLFTAIDLVRTADNDRDLDEAASKIAACVVAVGVTTLMALLIHNVAKVTGEFPAKKTSIRQPPSESPPPLEPKLQERPVENEPVKPPVDLKRPYIRKAVRDAVEKAAPRAPDGRPIDPNTFQPIDGTPDLGHKPGHEFWREKQAAEAEGLTQEQFNDRMNNPDWYQLEDPSSNRSHKYEQPR